MRMLQTVAIVVMTSAIFVAEATAQTPAPPVEQSPQKILQGQIKSINPARTEITLTDGTKLVAPPGAAVKQGAVTEGMTVIASYREQNGEKVLTELAVEKSSASPPTDPRLPAGPPPAAPGSSPPVR
jgi:hypothetical protein